LKISLFFTFMNWETNLIIPFILDIEQERELSNKLACALRLFKVKSCCNLTDDAFWQIMIAVNSGVVNLYQVKKTLKSIVSIKPTWVDMCIKSCHAYTGKYKDYDKCNICQTPRFREKERIPQCQMAYFSIKDHLRI